MAEGLIGAIQAKCNELRDEYIPAYEAIGPAGAFAIAMMRFAIKKAEEAVASGDTIGMISSLNELREFKM